MDFFGQIDLTALGQIAREHPEAVKVIQKKDGTQHKYINISVNERKEPNQFGHTHYIRVGGIPKASQKPGVNYYIADLKPSVQQQTAAPAPQQQAGAAPSAGDDNLPF